jgi:sn-glycerol 3-phosphate transport system substrate-binding protein
MNTFSRRGFLGLAGVAGTTIGLSACAGTGGGSTDSGSSGSASASAIKENTGPATGTIEFWSNHPGTSKDTELKIIAEFEKANPGVKVNLVDAGKNYEEVAQKFNASLAGGQLPDVVVVSDVTWFNFALNKQLAPLDDFAKAIKLDTTDYVDALYNDYKFNNGHYAVPYARSTPLFYYNKDLWAKAGLEDRGPKDWKEMKEWAAKLKPHSPDGGAVMALADGSNYLDWVLQNEIWEFGGAYSDEWKPKFTDAKTIEALTFFQGMVKDGYVKFSKDAAADFGAGLTACGIMSTGSLGGVTKNAKFPFTTAFLPGKDNCPTGGAGVGIPAGITEERKINALKFAAFLTNTESTVTFTQATGYMPVRKSALQNDAEKAFLDANPNSKVAVEQLASTRSQDNARVLVPGGGAKIGKALDQIVAGEDVKTVMEGVQKDIEGVIASQITPKLPKS